ncbi:hypothetical protein Fuma_00150 [Fuerstiella marisgermanici]|uniref:Uncharacterized protein n=1 Tax=Fuerstiella marisgermanici TaxID=1891926 RepID=A0A1P8W952_9PLAN|nr:hypothetical protein Fuma_00150 [Fuerstiella marisgermanici]
MHLQDAKNKEILTGCQLKNVFYHSGIPDGRHRVEESTFRSGFRLRAAKAFSGGGIARVTRCRLAFLQTSSVGSPAPVTKRGQAVFASHRFSAAHLEACHRTHPLNLPVRWRYASAARNAAKNRHWSPA